MTSNRSSGNGQSRAEDWERQNGNKDLPDLRYSPVAKAELFWQNRLLRDMMNTLDYHILGLT